MTLSRTSACVDELNWPGFFIVFVFAAKLVRGVYLLSCHVEFLALIELEIQIRKWDGKNGSSVKWAPKRTASVVPHQQDCWAIETYLRARPLNLTATLRCVQQTLNGQLPQLYLRHRGPKVWN